MNVKSISTKENFFYAFLVYCFISFTISVTSFVLFREIEKIDKTTQLVSSLRNKIQVYIRLDNEFLLYEIINPQYYETSQSRYIDSQNVIAKEILSLTDSIMHSEKAMVFKLDEDVATLKKLFLEKESIREEIFNTILLIGFKDHGYMGEMRKAIHYIEKVSNIDMANLLMLRRHEKDYFLRNDSSYIFKHQNEEKKFRESILSSKSIPMETKEEVLKRLTAYSALFERIVQMERSSGYKNKMGLTSKMKIKTEQIDLLINNISSTAEIKRSDIVKKIQLVIVIMITLSIVLLLMLAVSFNFVIKTNKE
jgi:hypothetical protein